MDDDREVSDSWGSFHWAKVKAIDNIRLCPVFVLLVLASGCATPPPETIDAGGVYNLTLTTDGSPDLTSVETAVASVVRPGMSDEDRCTALFELVRDRRFWHPEAHSGMAFLQGGVDPILYMNCFAPSICEEEASMLIALWSQLGYGVRMWQLGGHTTSEVYFGGRWRHYDITKNDISRNEHNEVIGIAERTTGNWLRPKSFVSHTDNFLIGHRMEMRFRPGESFVRYWRPLGKEPDYYSPAAGGARPSDKLHGKGTPSEFKKAMDLCPRPFSNLPEDAAYANGIWR